MTHAVFRGDSLHCRGNCIEITSRFLDCERVGGQGAQEEEREEEQRRAAAGRQAVASVMD